MKNTILSLVLLFLALGLSAQESSEDTTEVKINEPYTVLDSTKSGRNISLKQSVLELTPNMQRRLGDFTRLVPYAQGNSYMGYNPQFNRYTLNGIMVNNSFGFDGVLLGDQANTQLFSTSIIQEVNVNASPFDLSQSGFTGALVEVETKSGTDEFQSSGYLYFNNQSFTGDKIRGGQYDFVENSFFQAGVNVAGPIIKDKLHYYANFEVEEYSFPGADLRVNRDTELSPNENRVRFNDMIFLRDLFSQTYGYDLGEIEAFTRNNNSEKVFLKLDYEFNDEHQLDLTYNFLNAYAENNASSNILGYRGPSRSVMQFSNSGYSSETQAHVLGLELNSKWSENVKNNFKLAYTNSSDARTPFSSPMPAVMIKRLQYPYIFAGHDPLSANFRLDQNTFQLSNDFTYIKGKHQLKAGIAFERYDADASLNFDAYEASSLNYPGGTFNFGFNSLVEFVNYFNSGALDAVIAIARQEFTQNELNNGWDRSESSIGTASLYVQDEFRASDKLTLSLGVRVDQPMYFNTEDKIQEAIDRKGGVYDAANNPEGAYAPQLDYFDAQGQAINLDHTTLPETPLLIAPRFAFEYRSNWLNGMTISGGSGVYNGRIPGTWLNHHVDNPDNSNLMALGPNFRIPQVLRNNLNLQFELSGFRFTTDFTYSMNINAPEVKNFGLGQPSTALSGLDFREYYNEADKALDVDGNPGQNAYVMTSESEGSSINAFIVIEKDWPFGLTTSGAYNYTEAQNIGAMVSPVISDNFWQNAVVDNANANALVPSRFGNQHNFWLSLTKAMNYGKWNTQISLLNQVSRGGRFSYVYAGDANNDGIPHNDLVYIPTGAELSNYTFVGSFPVQEAQRIAMNNFINQDPYLSSRRGGYAKRNAGFGRWHWQMDLRVVQTLKWKNQRIDFSLDLLNFGNFLNSDWGIQRDLYNQQPFGVEVDPATREPTYFFDTRQDESFVDQFGLNSRWRMRFGLNYYFN